MAYYLRGKYNQGLNKAGKPKSTVAYVEKKKQVARLIVDELHKRIHEGKLDEISTDKLIDTFTKLVPKEHNVQKDTVVQYISNVPKSIDITPKPKQINDLGHGED